MAATVDTHCVPTSVHTHTRQPSKLIASFQELLQREPPRYGLDHADEAFLMSDYCVQARAMMEQVIRLLESIDDTVGGTTIAHLTANEQRLLKHRRAQWNEHLRGSYYTLVAPPPASGGETSRYSLAVELWLLIAHANVILQQSNAVGELFEFKPPASVYLSRNRLVIDTQPVMNYPMRTATMALEHFAASLDTIDRFHVDYTRYALALEHRISEIVCHTGSAQEYNAPEWCVPHVRADGTKEERVSSEYIVYAMCWLVTITNYAEGWCACNVAQNYDPLTRAFRVEQIRVPAHEVANADWMPSARSLRRLTIFLCEYAYGMKADEYHRELRNFLLQFDMRPFDLDLYRVLMKNNFAHTRSVLQHEFRGVSHIARAYLRLVHHNRSVHSYLIELLQWAEGDAKSTRSGALLHFDFTRQLSVFYTLHRYIDSKFGLDFRGRFLIIHRSAAFIKLIEQARTMRWPVIVQQFSRFTVFVPHRREPHIDIRSVLEWRAAVRAKRRQLPPPVSTIARSWTIASDDDMAPTRHVRTYDCLTALDAIALWAMWMLELTNGHVDKDTDMSGFLPDLLGW